MYSVPMGFPNEGEWVTADQALNMAPVFFDQVSRYNGNKPVYVDQFLLRTILLVLKGMPV